MPVQAHGRPHGTLRYTQQVTVESSRAGRADRVYRMIVSPQIWISGLVLQSTLGIPNFGLGPAG